MAGFSREYMAMSVSFSLMLSVIAAIMAHTMILRKRQESVFLPISIMGSSIILHLILGWMLALSYRQYLSLRHSGALDKFDNSDETRKHRCEMLHRRFNIQ